MNSEPYDKTRSRAADERREERAAQKRADDLSPEKIMAMIETLARRILELKEKLDPVLQANGNNMQIAWPKIEVTIPVSPDSFRGIVFPDGVAQYADINGTLQEVVTT
jgi:hypothetical protein